MDGGWEGASGGDRDRDRVTSEASRSSLVSGRWVSAPFVILLGAALAADVLGLFYDGSGPMPWTAAAAAAAVLVGGSVLTGLVVGEHVSRRVFVASLFVPLPTVLIAFVMMLGMSQSEEVLLPVELTLLLYALCTVPLIATLMVLSAFQRRASVRVATVAPGPPPLEPELKAATKGGRAITVVRNYVDDQEGRAHLEADKVALIAYGYDLVAVESRPAWRRLVRLTLGILLWEANSDLGAARVIATFQRPHRG